MLTICRGRRLQVGFAAMAEEGAEVEELSRLFLKS